MQISRNPSFGKNQCRPLPRVKRLRNVKELLSTDLMPRGVRYGSNLSLTLRKHPLTIKSHRQPSLLHPQLQLFLRTNASPARTTDPSGRSSNAKSAASKHTRERSASSLNHWTWTVGCASFARTIKCRRHRWTRLVCFVPRSSAILRMGFTRPPIRSCVRRSLQRGRDGCM